MPGAYHKADKKDEKYQFLRFEWVRSMKQVRSTKQFCGRDEVRSMECS